MVLHLCKGSEYFYHWNFIGHKKRHHRLGVNHLNISINNFPLASHAVSLPVSLCISGVMCSGEFTGRNH